MARTVVAGLLAVGMLILMPAKNMAEVPDFVNYSGRLTDGTAWGQSTTLSMTFRLYVQKEGGSPLWEQPFPDLEKNPEGQPVAVQDGYFSVVLGEGTGPNGQPLNVSDVFADDDQTWISVCLGENCLPEEDMLPRQQIGSVPYAVKAEVAVRATECSQSEVASGGIRYSLSAVYRGTTKDVGELAIETEDNPEPSFISSGATAGRIKFQGALGARAAKLACEVALGSPSAHMCMTHEMVRSQQMGLLDAAPQSIWIASGIVEVVIHPADGMRVNKDCAGWTVNEEMTGGGYYNYGFAWMTEGYTLTKRCSSGCYVACCDHPEE